MLRRKKSHGSDLNWLALSQNSSSILVKLRHGWMACCHFDGRYKMTILRGRSRPDCLGSKGSDGLDTGLNG